MSESPTPRVAIESGFFTVPDDAGVPPLLLGCRCLACGEHLFPRRVVCAACLGEDLEDTLLGPRGRLYTYTYVHVPFFGSRRADAGGYGVGQVDLPEGPRVQAVLSGGPDDFAIGMEMELELEILRLNDDGSEVVIFRFRPVGANESRT